MFIRGLIVAPLFLFASTVSAATYVLEGEQSSVHFVTVKNDRVAETHHFAELSGGVAADGKADLTIQLASVDTKIEIRDERMRNILFKVADYPVAKINIQLEPSLITALQVGVSERHTLPMTLSLHGKEKEYQATLRVTALPNGIIQVVTENPIMVDSVDFALADGVETLREIAKLSNILPVVPVTAVLVFKMK